MFKIFGSKKWLKKAALLALFEKSTKKGHFWRLLGHYPRPSPFWKITDFPGVHRSGIATFCDPKLTYCWKSKKTFSTGCIWGPFWIKRCEGMKFFKKSACLWLRQKKNQKKPVSDNLDNCASPGGDNGVFGILGVLKIPKNLHYLCKFWPKKSTKSRFFWSKFA